MMDREENVTNCEHVIDIRSTTEAPSVDPSHGTHVLNPPQPTTTFPLATSSSNRRRNGNNRNISLQKTKLCLWMELAFTAIQIIAAVIVLYFSNDDHHHYPFFGWVFGYAIGCAAFVPLLCFRLHYYTQASVNESSQIVSVPNPRLIVFVECFNRALNYFFILWFAVGITWIFSGHTSKASNLYRLSVVFLAISFFGYAMPFILCAAVCCCLPYIGSALGLRVVIDQNRGATSESINSLPTYKFKIKKTSLAQSRGNNSSAGEGGVVAAGTEKERAISGEDAACCICLAKYENNNMLRELPCFHLFHKECVDKWLKINALCPLCNSQVGKRELGSTSGSSLQTGETRSVTINL